jgi:MYXO-CTERM domain-containing protein
LADDPVECQSGNLADGMCCDSTCDLGVCDACSVAGGAAVDGTCQSIVGDCGDDNDCTADACNPVSGCYSVSITDGTVCGAGVCVAGSCVPDQVTASSASSTGSGATSSGSAGGADDGSGGADPGKVRLEGGGVCSASIAGSRRAPGLGAWLMLALAAALARRRRADLRGY